MRIEIREVQQTLGIPTVMVTHDQEEAMTMADRIICMRDGIVEQMGTPFELYNKPSNTFIARFLGNMNILDDFFQDGKPTNKLIVNEVIDPSKSYGIRPEEVLIVGSDQTTKNNYQGKVISIENLGSVSLIQIQIEASSILVERAGFTPVNTGDELWLSFPPVKIVSFERSKVEG